MPKPHSTPKKKNAKPTFPAVLTIIAGLFILGLVVLWSSLFKDYPVNGPKQMLAINPETPIQVLLTGWLKTKKSVFQLF